MNRPRLREAPRISLNVLTEYLTASALRRRSLITQQKRPKAFQVTYYREAEEAVVAFLLGDTDAPRRTIDRLEAGSNAGEWELARRASVVEAIRRFQASDLVDFNGFSVQRGANGPPMLSAGFVEISVRPEIVLSPVSSAGGSVGCIKLYFSKAERLGEERAEYAGAILYKYLNEVYLENAERASFRAAYRSCFVWDVLGCKVVRAPHAHRRRWREVEAACAEIAQVWPTV